MTGIGGICNNFMKLRAPALAMAVLANDAEGTPPHISTAGPKLDNTVTEEALK